VGLFRIEAPVQRDVGEVGGLACRAEKLTQGRNAEPSELYTRFFLARSQLDLASQQALCAARAHCHF